MAIFNVRDLTIKIEPRFFKKNKKSKKDVKEPEKNKLKIGYLSPI